MSGLLFQDMVKKTLITMATMMTMTCRPMARFSGPVTARPQPAGPVQLAGRVGLRGKSQLRLASLLSDCKTQGRWWGCRSALINRWSSLSRAALPTLQLHHHPKVLGILRALTGSPSQAPVGAARLGSTPAQAPRGSTTTTTTTSLYFTRTFSRTLLRAAGLHRAKAAATPRQQAEAAKRAKGLGLVTPCRRASHQSGVPGRSSHQDLSSLIHMGTSHTGGESPGNRIQLRSTGVLKAPSLYLHPAILSIPQTSMRGSGRPTGDLCTLQNMLFHCLRAVLRLYQQPRHLSKALRGTATLN